MVFALLALFPTAEAYKHLLMITRLAVKAAATR